MAYLDRQPLHRRLANLGTAGLIELAIGATLIAGLSVTTTRLPPPPHVVTTDIRDDPPPPPEQPQPPAHPIDTTITAPKPPIVIDQVPVPMPTPIIDTFPFPETGPTRDPLPTPQPGPSLAPVSAKPANDPSRWVTTLDYPARDLREGNQGTTRFRAIVGSNGRVQACEPIATSGFASLDKAACDNIKRRARFEPATDDSGAKVVGSYVGSVVWRIPR